MTKRRFELHWEARRDPSTRKKLPAVTRVFELETEGNDLVLPHRRRFPSPEARDAFVLRRLVRLSRGGYREVPTEPSGPDVHLPELLARGDDRLLAEVLACSRGKRLAALSEPWRSDARPAVRAQLLAYVEDGCDRFGHKRLVKRLYKGAEAAGDDELVGAFAHAFDRWTRRALLPKRWGEGEDVVGQPCVPERLEGEGEGRESYGRFTRRTRRYLARRAFRYFRVIGRRDPERYVRAMSGALARYRDDELATPLALLDAWTLAHALHGRSSVLRREAWGISVAPGRTLGELAPAPYFPEAWAAAPERLLVLVRVARARLVRAWARDLLAELPAARLANLPVPALLGLAGSPHAEARAVAARAFGAVDQARLPLAAWLELLATEGVELASVVAAAFAVHVAPARLSLDDAVRLAGARTRAAASLGLAELRARAVSPSDLALVSRAASAPVEEVRAEACAWLGGVLAAAPALETGVVRDLFDARFAEPRALGLRVRRERFPTDLGLLLAASESPAPEVREELVRAAEEGLLLAEPGTARQVALTVILDTTRGKRRREALSKVARRIEAHPEELPALLPVLRFALASLRAPERRGAVAELARLALHPACGAEVRRLVPELTFGAEASL